MQNSQQNISKLNPTTHKKEHTPRSSWIHPRVTRMVQHLQINQCDTLHQQKKRQKPQDHLNRCRKRGINQDGRVEGRARTPS